MPFINIKKLAGIISALLLAGPAIAQQYQYQPFDNTISRDFTFGTYDRASLDIVRYDKDASAHALVLKEYGKAAITSNGSASSLTFEYHVKIKIFDSKALNKGVIELPFYVQDNGTYEEIRPSSIQAVTFYKDANGAMRETQLVPDSIFTLTKNKHWGVIKFDMPNVRSGCIIEYRYRLDSPFLDKLRTWDFQSDIPKLSSKYEVHIPTVFGYNVSLQGPLKFSKDSVAVEKNCFESTNLKCDCSVESYEMVNIPAFKSEPYISSPKNFLSSLHFQLTQNTKINNFANLNQAFQQSVGDTWADVDKMLLYFDNFGSQLNKKSIFKDKIPAVTAGLTDSLEKAKAIYAYIQKNIVFDNLYDIYADEGIKKAIDKHTGNVADINLALVDALNEAGIYTDAVITSTRDNGFPGKLYPAPTEFNYVIAITSIGGKTYLLDATDPLLPFGMLPSRALNGPGRVIPLDKPSYWINIVTPQRSTNTWALDYTLDANGKMTGIITHYSIGYAAYKQRKQIAYYSRPDGPNMRKNSISLDIQKTNIGGLDDINAPLSQVDTVKIDNGNNGQFTLAPFKTLDTLISNPFTAVTRIYPVDFGMPSATSFTLTLHLPDNYTVDNPPQNTTLDLPGNGGNLSATFDSAGNTITYTFAYHIDKSNFAVAEYPALRDFFDKIALAENTVITIKKK
jgi:hypothetical protein